MMSFFLPMVLPYTYCLRGYQKRLISKLKAVGYSLKGKLVLKSRILRFHELIGNLCQKRKGLNK